MNPELQLSDLITIGEACNFTKWVGYNAVRCSEHEFNCRIDNYKSRYTLLDTKFLKNRMKMSNLTAGPEQSLNELREQIYGHIDQLVADALKESDTKFKNMNLKYDVARMMAIRSLPFIMALIPIGILMCLDILNFKNRVVK